MAIGRKSPQKEKIEKELEQLKKKQKELLEKESSEEDSQDYGEETTEEKKEEKVTITKREYMILSLRDPAIAVNEILAQIENTNQCLNDLKDKIDDLIEVAKES